MSEVRPPVPDNVIRLPQREESKLPYFKNLVRQSLRRGDLPLSERHKIARERTADQLLTMRKESQTSTDKLTGLLTRNAFEKKKAEVVKRQKRTGEKVTIVRLDENNLKQENDLKGHGAGDTLLANTGMTILEGIRDTDFAGRVGGDEFEIIMEGSDISGAKELWQRLDPVFSERGISISAGAAEMDSRTDSDLAESNELADDAQCIAKLASRTSGRSEFRTTDDLSEEDIIKREELRRRATERVQFEQDIAA